jgi:hypothetical protein
MAQEFNAPPAPPARSNRNTIIAIVVAILLLCCCCLVIAIPVLWSCGDMLLGTATECAPLFAP